MADESTHGRGHQGRKGRKLAPRSWVWDHFDRITDDQRNILKSVCKYCKQEYAGSYGTTNLKKHYERLCPGRVAAAVEAPPPGALMPPAHEHVNAMEEDEVAAPHEEEATSAVGPAGGSMGHEPAGLEEATKHLARLIALRGYDPSLVEDDCFRSFVACLNPEFKVPSRDDIKEMCRGVFGEARRDLFSKLECATERRISLSVGTERTTEGDKVLYTACHFIDDEWNLQKVVLDTYVDVPFKTYCDHFPDKDKVAHKAYNVIMDINEYYGFSNRLFMMAWEEKGLELKELVNKKLSYTYPASQELICATYADNMLCSIARSFIDSYQTHVLSADFVDIFSMATQKHQQILTDLELDCHHWAHVEDWYFCYCSLKILRTKYPSADIVGEILCNIWGGIHHAIRTISASSCPTSHLGLRELFKVREILQSELARVTGKTGYFSKCKGYYSYYYIKDVADVIRKAKDTFDEAIKDSYLIWSITHVLDPRYKLNDINSIFETAYGPKAAGNMTIKVTRKIKKLYNTDHIGDESDGGGDSNTDHIGAESDDGGESDDPLVLPWYEHSFLLLREPDHHLEVESELDHYLEDPVVPTTEDFDILNWWKDHCCQYPTVAQMARNALAMPASSILSSEQMAHVRSLVRGYSTEKYEE